MAPNTGLDRGLLAAIPPGGRLEVLEAVPSYARRANHGYASRYLGAGPNLPGSLALPMMIVEGPVGRWATSKLHFGRHFAPDIIPAPAEGWGSFRRISSLFVRRAIGEAVVLPHGALVQVKSGCVLTDRSGMSWPLSPAVLRAAYRPLSWAGRLGYPAIERTTCVMCRLPAADVRQMSELSSTAASATTVTATGLALCISHASADSKAIWEAVLAHWQPGAMVARTLADGRTILVGV